MTLKEFLDWWARNSGPALGLTVAIFFVIFGFMAGLENVVKAFRKQKRKLDRKEDRLNVVHGNVADFDDDHGKPDVSEL